MSTKFLLNDLLYTKVWGKYMSVIISFFFICWCLECFEIKLLIQTVRLPKSTIGKKPPKETSRRLILPRPAPPKTHYPPQNLCYCLNTTDRYISYLDLFSVAIRFSLAVIAWVCSISYWSDYHGQTFSGQNKVVNNNTWGITTVRIPNPVQSCLARTSKARNRREFRSYSGKY